MSTLTFSREYLKRRSFIELNARERAKSLFDARDRTRTSWSF